MWLMRLLTETVFQILVRRMTLTLMLWWKMLVLPTWLVFVQGFRNNNRATRTGISNNSRINKHCKSINASNAFRNRVLINELFKIKLNIHSTSSFCQDVAVAPGGNAAAGIPEDKNDEAQGWATNKHPKHSIHSIQVQI